MYDHYHGHDRVRDHKNGQEMRKLPRTRSRITSHALILFGAQIRQARTRLKMTGAELAERVGISRTTLAKIEKGDPHVEIGLAFEAAILVGIPLFDVEGSSLGGRVERLQDKLALLPRAVRKTRSEVKDDF
jgi:DNA-binding XRE family transcriptional regulator